MVVTMKLFFWYECPNPVCRCFDHFICSLIPLQVCPECEQPVQKIEEEAAFFPDSAAGEET
jgi:hypothetical protein